MRLLLWLYMLNLKFAIRTANWSALTETPQMQNYIHTKQNQWTDNNPIANNIVVSDLKSVTFSIIIV